MHTSLIHVRTIGPSQVNDPIRNRISIIYHKDVAKPNKGVSIIKAPRLINIIGFLPRKSAYFPHIGAHIVLPRYYAAFIKPENNPVWFRFSTNPNCMIIACMKGTAAVMAIALVAVVYVSKNPSYHKLRGLFSAITTFSIFY